jgi:hypothetical protein
LGVMCKYMMLNEGKNRRRAQISSDGRKLYYEIDPRSYSFFLKTIICILENQSPFKWRINFIQNLRLNLHNNFKLEYFLVYKLALKNCICFWGQMAKQKHDKYFYSTRLVKTSFKSAVRNIFDSTVIWY